jgi:hypothetical protein
MRRNRRDRHRDMTGPPRTLALPGAGAHDHPARMFCVTEAEAAAIRSAYEQGGEFSAAIELRRLFPGITDNAKARECAQAIAGWTPLPDPVPKVPGGLADGDPDPLPRQTHPVTERASGPFPIIRADEGKQTIRRHVRWSQLDARDNSYQSKPKPPECPSPLKDRRHSQEQHLTEVQEPIVHLADYPRFAGFGHRPRSCKNLPLLQ